MTEEKWFSCSFCGTVQKYIVYDGDDGQQHSTFPRGEWLAHQKYITTDFNSKEAAQDWLRKEQASEQPKG